MGASARLGKGRYRREVERLILQTAVIRRDVAWRFTAVIRQSRFLQSALAAAFASGLNRSILRRAGQLAWEMDRVEG